MRRVKENMGFLDCWVPLACLLACLFAAAASHASAKCKMRAWLTGRRRGRGTATLGKTHLFTKTSSLLFFLSCLTKFIADCLARLSGHMNDKVKE